MFRPKFEAHDLFNMVSVACISQRRNLLFTANPLQAWSLVEGTTPPRLSFPRPTRCICLSIDERTIAVASGSAISVIDVDSATEIRTLAGHLSNINAIAAFNKNVYCWASGGDDGQCILWNVASHPPNVLRIRVQAAVLALALSPDDQFCVIGTDVSLEIYDLRQRGLKIKHIPGISVHGVCFHPREFLLSTFGGDRAVRFWDLETFECVGASEMVDSEIKRVSFAPNGDLLIACTDESLHLVTWEPVTEVARSDLPPQAKVISVQPTSESLDILCAFADRSIGLYNTTYEQILAGDVEDLAVEDVDPFEDLRMETHTSTSPLTDQGSDGAEGAITPISEGCSPQHEPQLIPMRVKDEMIEVVHRIISTSVLEETPSTSEPKPKSSPKKSISKQSTSRSTSSLTTLDNSGIKRSSTPENQPPITPKSRSTTKKTPLIPDMRPRNSSTGKLSEKTNASRADRSLSVSDRKVAPSREINRTNSVHKNKISTNGKNPESLIDVLNMVVSSHNDHLRRLEDQKKDLISLTDLIRRKGVLSSFELLDGNKRELALLIKAISYEGGWTLALAVKVLSRLRLLSPASTSPTSSAVNRSVMVNALNQIVSELGPRIRECAHSSPSNIGVDVAAEERHEQAQKCLQSLMELRINSSFIGDKLPPEEKRAFEKTLTIIDDLCKD